MYKIIQNEKVIDVVRNPQFFLVSSSGNVAFTDKLSAHGIVSSDGKTLYAFGPVPKRKLDIVTIEKITLDELNRLQNLLSSGQEPDVDENSKKAVYMARQNAIEKLSATCKAKIIAGFSIRLSDGAVHNFKLTVEDQLNLLSIENQLNTGATTFLYHETDKLCRAFSKNDMIKVINEFRRHTLYHTTYFNTAKQYINILTDLEKINKFTYGDAVSEIVTDETVKRILNKRR